jgi:hypothetical protein
MTMIRPNTAEGLVYRARNSAGEPITGLDVTVRIFNPANGQIWDWSTSAFSASPVTPTATMTQVDAVNMPGYYYRSWPGAAAGNYLAEYSPPAGQTADDYPDPAELRVREDAAPGDQMALTSGERTTLSAVVAPVVWATATPNAAWTYGASLVLLRKHVTNRLDVTAADDGTLTLYDDDGTTEIVEQSLRDGGGRTILLPTGSPALRGAAE